MSDHGFWAVQSLVTEPGPAAAAIDRLRPGLGALRAASQQLVFHCWADGNWAENGIAPERISEIDTRYAAAMFARLGELADLPLSAARQPGSGWSAAAGISPCYSLPWPGTKSSAS